MNWEPHPQALELLDAVGGPFEASGYRRAAVATLPEVTDQSFGARATDGTMAAVALVGDRYLAESVPPEGYGSIRASRPLSSDEAAGFLRAARRATGARQLWFRTVALPGDQPVDWSFAREIAEASVIPVDAGHAPAERYSRLTKRSIRKALEAGGKVTTTGDGRDFLGLYAEASSEWSKQYPHELILELGRAGVGRFDMVSVGGRPVAGLMTLLGAEHWMCWLAAQSAAGRDASASYLAYDRLLTDAGAAVPFVSLGASAPGTGGVEFKRRLGATECPVFAWEAKGLVARLGDARANLRAR